MSDQSNTTWFQRFRAGFAADNNGSVVVADTESDPRAVELIITQGDLDDLNGRISGAENYARELVTSHTAQIQELTSSHTAQIQRLLADHTAQIQEMRRTEAHVIPRLFKLATNVGKLLKAVNVSTGEVIGNDRVRYLLSNDASAWLELVIDPFREAFVVIDANGIMANKSFHFGNDTDLSYDTILMLTGFATFASRNDAADSAEFWTGALDDQLKLLDESTAVAANN